jgi:hypothetical protein
MTLDVEGVVTAACVERNLWAEPGLEALHASFSQPDRKVRVFGPVVTSSASDVFDFHSEIAQRGDEHLIKMPASVCGWMRFPELSGIGDAKRYGPAANSFIGDIHATLRQQILDIPKAQRKSEIQPDGMLDDLGRKTVAVIGDGVHR